jgi:hypothetical protein
MLWLVDSQGSATWKGDVSEASPAELFDGSLEADSSALELCHRGLEVVAHEVELVARLAVGVKSDLRGG